MRAVRVQHRVPVGEKWEVRLIRKLVHEHTKPRTRKEMGGQWTAVATFFF